MLAIKGCWDAGRVPKIDRLVMLPMPEANARTAALLSGQVDWIEAPSPDAALATLYARTVEEAPFVWIAHDVGPRAIAPKVKGVVQPRSGFIDIAILSIE